MSDDILTDDEAALGLCIGSQASVLAWTHDGKTSVAPAMGGSTSVPLGLVISNGQQRITAPNPEITEGEYFIPIQGPFDIEDEPSWDEPNEGLSIIQYLKAASENWKLPAVSNVSDSKMAVSVPGWFDQHDEQRFLRILEAAGFKPVGAVREPLPIAYDAGIHILDSGRFLVARVGSTSTDIAILEPNTESRHVTTSAYRSVSKICSTTFQNTIHSYLAEEYDAYSNLSDEEARSILERVPEIDGGTGIAIPGTNTEVTIDAIDLDHAFEGLRSDFQVLLKDIASDAGLDSEDITGAAISGLGSEYPFIWKSINGIFDLEMEPDEDDDSYDAASARGSSIIASLFGDNTPEADSRLKRSLVIEVLGDDESEYVSPLSATINDGEEQQISLRTTEDNQTRAVFRIGTKHRLRETYEEIAAFEVARIPPASAGNRTVCIAFTLKNADVADDSESVSLEDYSIEMAGDTDLVTNLNTDLSATGPLLTLQNRDVSDLSPPDRDQYEPVYRTDPNASSYEDLSPKRAIEQVVDIRNELRNIVQNNDSFSAEDLWTRVKKMDVGLQQAGITMITPEIGEKINDEVHQIKALEPSNDPEGTIIEIWHPGYKIDDTVIEEAKVVISNGESPTPSDSGDSSQGGDSNSEPDTVTTGDTGPDENEDTTSTSEGPSGNTSSDADHS